MSDWLKEREQDLQSLRNDTLTENWMQSVLGSSESLVSSDRLYPQSLSHCALGTRSNARAVDSSACSCLTNEAPALSVPIRVLNENLQKPALLRHAHKRSATFLPRCTPITPGRHNEVAVAQGIFDKSGQRDRNVLVGTTDLSRLSEIDAEPAPVWAKQTSRILSVITSPTSHPS